MPATQIKITIGAKRQITLPREAMQRLDLQEGSELLLNVTDDNATLTPIVSILRSDLPQDLRAKLLARRGAKPTDLPLDQFLTEYVPSLAAPKKTLRGRGESPEKVAENRHVRSREIA